MFDVDCSFLLLVELLGEEGHFCKATLKKKKKTRLITQQWSTPGEGMQTSSYPLTHTGIALCWEKLWNASKDVK